MKLTKEMFDFEKYDYSFGALSANKEYINIVSGAWSQAYPSDEGGSPRIMRELKPPPRYILLNEGEILQEGEMTKKEALEVINKTHLYMELMKCGNQVADEIVGHKLPLPYPLTAKLLEAAKVMAAEVLKLEGAKE